MKPMNTEVTRGDVEEFETCAAAARDYESAAVCAIALGSYIGDVYDSYPQAARSRIDELAPDEETAWSSASSWVLAARAMED